MEASGTGAKTDHHSRGAQHIGYISTHKLLQRAAFDATLQKMGRGACVDWGGRL